MDSDDATERLAHRVHLRPRGSELSAGSRSDFRLSRKPGRVVRPIDQRKLQSPQNHLLHSLPVLRRYCRIRYSQADHTQDTSLPRPRRHRVASRRDRGSGFRNGNNHHVPAGAGRARRHGSQEDRREGLGPARDWPDDLGGPYGGGAHHRQQHEPRQESRPGRGGRQVRESMGLLDRPARRRWHSRFGVQDGPEGQQGGRRGLVRLLKATCRARWTLICNNVS